jgi:beta-glucosidase
MININRTWHWGRSADTYGEDPYLTGEMTVNEVNALQGHHVVTVLRHYLANNQEIDRQTVLEQIPERALHEIYLYPWQQAVERSKVAGVRGWGFDGLVLPEPVNDPAAAIKAGTDILAPNVIDANVKNGRLDASVVDLIAFHILVPFFRIGVFDNPVAPLGVKVSTPEHRKLAEEAAEQGAVLLKNMPFKNGGSVLPLVRVRSLAIIGDDAGKNAVLAMTSARVPMENPSLPVDAITARAGSAVKVTYVPGNPGLGPLPAMAGEFAASFYEGPDIGGTPVAQRTDAGVDLGKFAPPAQLVPAGGRGRGAATGTAPRPRGGRRVGLRVSRLRPLAGTGFR